MALPSRRRSWTLGNVLLGTEFRLLATNFICTHLHDGAISVCMHVLVGVNHRCYVSKMDRNWSRA